MASGLFREKGSGQRQEEGTSRGRGAVQGAAEGKRRRYVAGEEREEQWVEERTGLSFATRLSLDEVLSLNFP